MPAINKYELALDDIMIKFDEYNFIPLTTLPDDKTHFNEWFKDNHYYNPITHRIEPLRIWSTMKLNQNGPNADKAGYVQKDSIITNKISITK